MEKDRKTRIFRAQATEPIEAFMHPAFHRLKEVYPAVGKVLVGAAATEVHDRADLYGVTIPVGSIFITAPQAAESNRGRSPHADRVNESITTDRAEDYALMAGSFERQAGAKGLTIIIAQSGEVK